MWSGRVPAAALTVLALLAGACGSGTPDPGGESGPTSVQTTTTTSPADATTTDPLAEVRGRFVDEAGGADSALGGLSDADLGCVADRLLQALEPDEVLAISALGPRPEQAGLTVGALEECDLVLALAGQGMVEALAEDPTMPTVEADCLLAGVTSDDLVPVLEAQFADPFGLELDDGDMAALLADSPIMGNLMRCRLRAVYTQDGTELPEFCLGLVDEVAAMMAAVMEVELGGQDLTDPAMLASLLEMSDDVFVWLADEVPPEQRPDAVVVRDATARIATIMAEALATLDASSTDEEALAAVFAASARIQAETGLEGTRLEGAVDGLRGYVEDTCGDSASSLFDLLAGVTGSPRAQGQ